MVLKFENHAILQLRYVFTLFSFYDKERNHPRDFQKDYANFEIISSISSE
jgi:hypothetical protein